MPSWNALVAELACQPDDQSKANWLKAEITDRLRDISIQRNNRNVLLYEP